MNMLPAASKAIRAGPFSRAVVAGLLSPLLPAVPVPAKVVAIPAGLTLMIRLLLPSAT